MKEALLYAVGDVRVVDSPKPTITDDDILVAVRSCGVCPTDARKYRTGNHGVPHWPFNMGHEWTADIVEVGCKVKKWTVGQRVAVFTWNGYSEYVKIGNEEFEGSVKAIDSILELPSSVSYEEGTFVEPLADVIHSVVDQAQLHIGERMVILGGGQLGQQHLLLAKAMGIRVLLSDLIEDRLQVATRHGAEVVVNPSKQDAMEAVRSWTNGRGADAVIVAAGATVAVEQAARMVKKGGRVVLFAGFEYNKEIRIDPNLLHYGEVILTGAYGVGVGPRLREELYAEALNLIASKQVPVADLVTHRFSLTDLKQALDTVVRQEGLKVMINVR